MSHMSPPTPPQAPYPSQPLGYATAMAPARPTSVTVIAIVTIIMASLGLVSQLISIPVQMMSKPGANPVYDAARNNLPFKLWMIFSGIVGIAMGIIQLIAAIKALSLVSWTRSALVKIAVLQIVLGLIGTTIAFVLVLPVVEQQSRANGAPVPVVPIMIGSMIVGMAIGLALPVCTIVFFRKPNVVAAFETSGK